ncbi:hypothetical protein J5TS2_05600 [Brevibacillus halotolerans]|nr:hypothetical protein [Brevibacillus halotolerans]GIN99891.1 hypothetical protein J5TS2_05600 [Brevibacillus halotolerans]
MEIRQFIMFRTKVNTLMIIKIMGLPTTLLPMKRDVAIPFHV